MPIPALSAKGLLPVGIHDCDLHEIDATFGRFNRSDRRVSLTKRLREYVELLLTAGIGRYLYVDGSFVTGKEEPQDIDLLLVLRNDVVLDQAMPPFEYNVRSGRFIRRTFGFDFFFGFEEDDSSEAMLRLFRRVKGDPGAEKGILRVLL
jgi:hypothetical protein